MTFTLYNFSKKTNSTLRPTQPGTEITGQLIEPFSLDKLNVKFRFTGNAPTYNYCFADSHLGGRHYFITNWSYENGVWIAHMEEDHLATYKTKIGNSTQYVVRAESTYDGSIPDNKSIYNTDMKLTYALNNFLYTGILPISDTVHSQWVTSTSNTHCYILVLNIKSYSYRDTPETQQFVLENTISCRVTLKGAYRIITYISEHFGVDYLSKYILGFYYCPIDYAFTEVLYSTELSGNAREAYSINFYSPTGNGLNQSGGISWIWTDGSIAYSNPTQSEKVFILTKSYIGAASKVVFDQRPSAILDDDWTYIKARDYYLLGQPFGRTQLDPNMFVNINTNKPVPRGSLYIVYYTDVFTGQTKVYTQVYDSQGALVRHQLYLTTIDLYAEVPLGATGVGDIKALQQQARTAITNGIAGMVGTVATMGATGLSTVVGNMQAQENLKAMSRNTFYQTMQRGDLTMGEKNIMLLVEDSCYTQEPASKVGRPLEQSKTINTLSGFVQCADVHLDFNIPETEKQAITSYMESGFYYE